MSESGAIRISVMLPMIMSVVILLIILDTAIMAIQLIMIMEIEYLLSEFNCCKGL